MHALPKKTNIPMTDPWKLVYLYLHGMVDFYGKCRSWILWDTFEGSEIPKQPPEMVLKPWEILGLTT